MILNREHWTKNDVKEFQEYLVSFSRPEKVLWTKNIINTKMPVLAILSPNIKSIVKEIAKGNFIEFIDLWIWEYYENTPIIGSLIMKIKDFETLKKYLLTYAEKSDNWATSDVLSFPINNSNKTKFFELAREMIASKKPFVRRVGINILFKFIEDDNYIEKIFDILNDFYNETEYYVNMVNSWLFAECFTKQREKTIEFLKTHHLNKFTINKGVQKCRDSYRISQSDKDMLVQYKK